MASIFTRFADIVSSNINSMLDKAEDPAKMLKLIVAEMEDTLVEIKAACAQAMADQAKNGRQLAGAKEKAALWLKRAEMAAAKGRDDLAKEALAEKRDTEEAARALGDQETDLAAVVERYRDEITQLEAKIAQAREKGRAFTHRAGRAAQSLRISGQMKRFDLADAKMKLERLDSRLDHLEAEADLEMASRQRQGGAAQRETAFREIDDTLDKELAELKGRMGL